MPDPVNDSRHHCSEAEQLEHPSDQPQNGHSVSRPVDETTWFPPTPNGKADRSSSKHRQKIKATQADRQKDDRQNTEQHGEVAADEPSVDQFWHFRSVETLRAKMAAAERHVAQGADKPAALSTGGFGALLRVEKAYSLSFLGSFPARRRDLLRGNLESRE
jgi:hypothetical protein